MSVRCIAIGMSRGGYRHEHIEKIQWINEQTQNSDISRRETMVTFIEDGNQAYVKDSSGDVAYLRVRVSSSGTKYVQTIADGIYNDNLLALPRL